MALPKLNSLTYELELPSSGEKLKYRPFLVKEQKALMIAQESEDDKLMEHTFAQIITDCVFDDVDPYTMPMFDIEYLFLRIRGKSVGEKVKLNVLCPDDEKTRVDVEIDLEKVDVQMTEDHTNIVNLTKDVTLVMKYPCLKDMGGFDHTGEVSSMFDMIKRCVHEVRDGETVYNKVDISQKELDEFIDSMSTENFEQVANFFNTMPKLYHEVEVKNPKTKKKNKIPIEGLQSFFRVALSHDTVENYYKTNFSLMQHHHYSLDELDNMMPWEREIYIGLLMNFLKEEEEERKKGTIKMAQKKLQADSKFAKYDLDGDGTVSDEELAMEERMIDLENRDKREDAQRTMAWYALGGMLLYPVCVVISVVAGIDAAAKILGDMAGVYFIAVAGIVAAFFGAQALTNKTPKK